MTQRTTLRFRSRSPRETHALAAALADCLLPGDLVGLQGELGTGKTTFTCGLVAALQGGDSADVSSPTFAITNYYRSQPPVYHLDFYRLESLDDLESTGYWDLVDRQDTIVVVEWIDRIPQALHRDAWRVLLAFLREEERQIDIEAPVERIAVLSARAPGGLVPPSAP